MMRLEFEVHGQAPVPLREAGSQLGEPRDAAACDRARLSRTVDAGERLPVRLCRTGID
jgi:hypothetical protein